MGQEITVCPSSPNGDEGPRYVLASPACPVMDMNNCSGTCVRVNDAVFALLRRLNLVYFRWYVPSTFYLHLSNVKLFSARCILPLS